MIQPPRYYLQNSASQSPPLRIGLLLDSTIQIPAFIAKIIEDIRSSNFVRIELIVGEVTANSQSVEKNGLLYRLYLQRLDARMKPANDPLARVDAAPLLAGIEIQKMGVDQQSVQLIRSKNLDVLLSFGINLPNELGSGARFGIWSLLPADVEYRGGPPHFWEMRQGSPITGMTLQASAGDSSQPHVLAKSLFATEKTLSVSRNRYIPYWGSTDLIIAKLHKLHAHGWDHVLQSALPNAAHKGQKSSYESPTNGDVLQWLAPVLLKKAFAFPFRKEIVQHWRIAIRVSGKQLHEPEANPDFSGFRWLEPPAGHAWADPFVFEHEGKFWAFFEDYSYQEMKAALACAEILPSGEFGPPTICLKKSGCHLSYPHVFKVGSDIFMIPESFESNSVDLYSCRKFPDDWVQETRLLEGKFVDTTVWEHDGLWWLATTSAEPMPGAGFLWLYYSRSLTGEWHFHPGNPISTDIRDSRGAGQVFRSKGRLIRPSQSCAPTYGYSFALNEITELSPQRYSERRLITVNPEHWKDIAGVHTYNCAGPFEVIDGRTPMPLAELKSQR